MLGRSSYTQAELDAARGSVTAQLAAYRKLAKAVAESGDAAAQEALDAFEPLLFNGMVLTLDRPFVHRVRNAAGKDSNPLNEVELLSESLMHDGGVLQAGTVIKYKPDETVLKLSAGERIALRRAQFEKLAKAFFAEIERKFM
jgi:hypothetical protein